MRNEHSANALIDAGLVHNALHWAGDFDELGVLAGFDGDLFHAQ